MTLPSPTDGPATTTVGFFDSRTDALADWLDSDLGSDWGMRRSPWRSRDEAIAALPGRALIGRQLLVPVDGWSLLVNNALDGTDVGIIHSLAARELGCVAIRATVADAGPQSYAARVLEVFGPGGKPPLLSIRSIAAANDGGRWVFETFGEPFPFERLDQYEHRRKGDRFTTELLYEYLRALGVPVDTEPDWANAYVLEHGEFARST